MNFATLTAYQINRLEEDLGYNPSDIIAVRYLGDHHLIDGHQHRYAVLVFDVNEDQYIIGKFSVDDDGYPLGYDGPSHYESTSLAQCLAVLKQMDH